MKYLFEIGNGVFLKHISYFFSLPEFRAALLVNKNFNLICREQVPWVSRHYLNQTAQKIMIELKATDGADRIRIDIESQIPPNDFKMINSFISNSPSKYIITQPLENIQFHSSFQPKTKLILLNALWIAILVIACLLLTGKLGSPDVDYSLLWGIMLGVDAFLMPTSIGITHEELKRIYHFHRVERYYSIARENTINIFSEQTSRKMPLLQDAKNNRRNNQENSRYDI